VNEAKHVRSKRLQRLLMTPPPSLERAYHRAVPRRFHGRLAAWAVHRNVANRRRPPLARELRERLVRVLEPDIRELAGLIDRDLSGWLTIGD
jgi:hypothetical protein